MEPLKIEQTDETPEIVLDKRGGVFQICGRSLPEDSASFYDPILQWVRLYVNNPNDFTHFIFRLEYSNTSSSKYIHEILVVLQKIKDKARVLWWHHRDDEDVKEAGIVFSEQIDIPFEFKAYD